MRPGYPARLLLIFTVALAVLAACNTVDEENSTATAQAVGASNTGDKQVLQRAGPVTIATPVAAPTATLAPAAAPPPTATPEPATTATPEPTARPTATPAPRPTATAVSSPTAIPSPTATPLPIATPPPTPTPLPTATPTATPVPAPAQWMTALQAARQALLAQPGAVLEITGHVALKAGVFKAGDRTVDEPSPGRGYANTWGVTVKTEDGDILFCDVNGDGTTCSASFHSGSSGDLAGVTADSTAVFATWAQNPDWNQILANSDVSLLLDLHADPGGSYSGGEVNHTWSALITVRDAGASPSSGNFHWHIESGETEMSTF